MQQRNASQERIMSDEDTADNRIREALKVIERFGGIDGGHHKTWVIDQVIRCLTGDGYDSYVSYLRDGEDGPNTYEHSEGIAP